MPGVGLSFFRVADFSWSNYLWVYSEAERSMSVFPQKNGTARTLQLLSNR
jgi:hypothetical protein